MDIPYQDYIDKTIIIGITRFNANNEFVEQIQMHGVISSASANGIKIRLSTGTDYNLPPDFDNVHAAPPGEYRFRSTGEVVVDPDFMTTWTLHVAPETT